MNKPWFIIFFCFALGSLSGCVEPFDLPTTVTGRPYLVVDGFLDTGQGTCTIKLSTSLDLSDPVATPPRTQGSVVVEASDQATYRLQLQPDGSYFASGIRIAPNTQYRLRVTTQNGEYLSDFVGVQNTPPIEELRWRADEEGIQVLVSTQDPTDRTRYFRWDYTETHEYVSGAQSDYVFSFPITKPIKVLPRQDQSYRCWKTTPGLRILLGSTVQLSQNVIHDFPLRRLGRTAPQLRIKYSILVRQHGISREEFSYWDLLRKNTESMGTLFDPQPAQVTGNIRSLNNAEEPVFGFFSAHSVQERRLFIQVDDLPFWPGFPRGCQTDSIMIPDLDNYIQYNLIAPIYDEMGMTVLGYTVASPECADCRLTGGGKTQAPAFWR